MKRKIIFIIGAPRSGSTYFDQFLGSFEGIFSCGETNRGMHELRSGISICSCGLGIDNCSFWGSVFKNINTEDNNFVQIIKKYNTKNRLFHFLNKNKMNNVRNYMSKFYNSVSNISGCNVLIDSSKDPIYAQVLSKIENFEPYFIHLVRDPRAVAYSWTKKKNDPKKNRNMKTFTPLYTTFKWCYYNLFSFLFFKNHKNYIQLQYEDLEGKDLQKLLKKHINEDLDLLKENLIFHNLNGNPDGSKRKVQEDFNVDKKWVGKVGYFTNLLIVLIAMPVKAFLQLFKTANE
tara:strand:+ start:14827 stop:15693 length:867 start_codon:yes stop_codon:yes gene_type:complete